MPIDTDLTAIVAQDGFEEYYAEKLWNWIPAFYREQDANTPTAGTLRGLVESMGRQSADLRRSLDRIWENAFVELADDDALEALGRLVATRMVHGLNRRARRVDVARTIYYRRRKGTPRVLESLLTDITGWTGAHLESRHRLARTYHLLEPAPDLAAAIFTNTPRGGWANLRSPRIPALAYTAFEELAHTPDFRRLAGTEGRYGIPKVNVHLHRARAFAIHHPTIVQIGSDAGEGEVWKYALDPSGRELQLFAPTDRPSSDSWARMREWQLAKTIERRLLDHNEYEWTKAQLVPLAGTFSGPEITMLEKYAGWRVPNLRELVQLMTSLSITASPADMVALMQETMIPQCGRRQLYGEGRALNLAIGANNELAVEVGAEELQVGNLVGWGASWSFPDVFDDAARPDHKLVVDPQRGAVISQSTNDTDNLLVVPVYHYGFPGEVGAGTYDRRESIVTGDVVTMLFDGNAGVGRVDPGLDPTNAVEELQNDKTYEITEALTVVADYRLQASNFTRPYLLYSGTTEGISTWQIEATGEEPGNLVLDGLWIGLEAPEAPTVSSPASPVGGRIRLVGTWNRVEIIHCTLDPGGEQMLSVDNKCLAIQYAVLEIAGYVEELVIDHSIVGPILSTLAGLNTCSVGKLIIRDSIVMTIDPAVPQAIDVALGNVHIERSTILGGIKANRLYATDSLVTGTGTITDRQNGCFRFSAGVQGNWPRPYESHFFTQFDPAWIEGRRFGDPNFTRLSEAAPLEIRSGAENHCEMGVWNHLLEEIKRADLRAKLGEFMPFDLDMQLVTEN